MCYPDKFTETEHRLRMLFNHFGELRCCGGNLAIILCTCNERHDEVGGTRCYVHSYEMAMGPC